MDQPSLKLLVTGASGFIGQHLVRHLARQGHRITALDYRPPANPFPEGVRFFHCDIRTDAFPQQAFDAVLHLAALAGVRPSINRPIDYETTNVTGTVRLLEFCRAQGVRQFVFASSSSVYGDNGGKPSAETDPLQPISPYALTKALAEQWGKLYSHLHGIRFVALRLFSVWGDGQRRDLALAAFTKALLDGQPVTINGDGQQRRDLTHVSDVVRAVALAVGYRGEDFAVFNVGTGRNHSVLETVKAAECFTGKKASIEHRPAHPTDVPETLASTLKSATCLDWRAEVPFG